jgi:hypothetical protein
MLIVSVCSKSSYHELKEEREEIVPSIIKVKFYMAIKISM